MVTVFKSLELAYSVQPYIVHTYIFQKKLIIMLYKNDVVNSSTMQIYSQLGSKSHVNKLLFSLVDQASYFAITINYRLFLWSKAQHNGNQELLTA